MAEGRSGEFIRASRLVRARGAFALRAAPVPDARAILCARPGADVAMARGRLERLAAAHGALAGGIIPGIAAIGDSGGTPYVVFECRLADDFDGVLQRARSLADKWTYTQGIASIEAMLLSLSRAHASGHCLGVFSQGNLVVSPDGDLALIGFGDNALALDEHGRPLKDAAAFAAPDVLAGAPPSPGADLYALTLFVRSLIDDVVLPPRVLRILQGAVMDGDEELGELFVWSNLAILASRPDARPSVEDALLRERRAWRLLGVEPDPEGLRAFYRRHLAVTSVALVTDAEVTFFALAGQAPVQLSSHRAARRILRALIELRLAQPGNPLSLPELAQAGWPGESVLPEAAANRVYVALSQLRKMGLGACVERHDGGWRLAPAVEVTVTAAAPVIA